MALKFKLVARYFQQANKQIDKYFVNSEGSKIRSFSPRVRMFYFLTLQHNGSDEQTSQNYGWSGGWEAMDELRMRERVREEATSTRHSLERGTESPDRR